MCMKALNGVFLSGDLLLTKKIYMEMGSILKYIHLVVVHEGEMGTVSL